MNRIQIDIVRIRLVGLFVIGRDQFHWLKTKFEKGSNVRKVLGYCYPKQKMSIEFKWPAISKVKKLKQLHRIYSCDSSSSNNLPPTLLPSFIIKNQ